PDQGRAGQGRATGQSPSAPHTTHTLSPSGAADTLASLTAQRKGPASRAGPSRGSQTEMARSATSTGTSPGRRTGPYAGRAPEGPIARRDLPAAPRDARPRPLRHGW